MDTSPASRDDVIATATSSSAAVVPPSVQLQQLHLAGQSTGNSTPVVPEKDSPRPAPSHQLPKQSLDFASEELFPSLGSSGKAVSNSSNSSAWGAAGKKKSAAERVAPIPSLRREGYITEVLDLPITQPRRTKEFGDKPLSTAEVVRLVKKKTNTQIDVSTASQTQTMTFLIHGKVEQARQAKRELLAMLATRVTVTLQVPSFVRPFILGSRGKTLQGITQRTGTKIDIPRREETPKGASTHDPEEDDYDVVSDITITGDLEGVNLAKTEIEKIVNEKTSKRVVRLTHIPPTYFPLIAGPHNQFVHQVMEEHNVKIRVPVVTTPSEPTTSDAGVASHSSGKQSEPAITVSGEKAAIDAAVAVLNDTYEGLVRTTRYIVVPVPKPLHRFLVDPKGSFLQEILERTGCALELPASHDPTDSVGLRGPESHLMEAMTLVMDKANAFQVDTIDLFTLHPSTSPRDHAERLLRYLRTRANLRKLETEHNAQIYLPKQPHFDHEFAVEIVAHDHSGLMNARQSLVEILKALPPHHMKVCHLEPHVHGHLLGRGEQNLKRIHKTHGVLIIPDRESGSSDVLLVYEQNPTVDCYIQDKRKHAEAVTDLLQQVTDELASAVGDAADYTTRTLHVPVRFHRVINGPKGATLSEIVGPDGWTFVSVGGTKNGDSAEDHVTIKGPVDEVERVAEEILRRVEEAERHEALHSFEDQVIVSQQYLPHVIGKGGSNISKLETEHDVHIDVSDKSAKNPQVVVHLKGTQQGIAAAKKAITTLTERLADHTVLSIHVNPRLHPALIGSQGRFARRLEEKYSVFIKFPKSHAGSDASTPERSASPTEPVGQKADEIIIKGGRRGVEEAKAELLELAEYEEAHNQSETFQVPASAIPYIVGRSGSQVNEIKDATNTHIDLGYAGEGNQVPVTVRGTKSGIAKARRLIEAVVADQELQTSVTLHIDAGLHKSLIGAGGSKIRDLISQHGGDQELVSGPGSCRVFFPPRNATSAKADEVVIKGDRTVVAKVSQALEERAQELKDRVCVTVNIPVADHPSIIGRGGATLREIQDKYHVDVDFASSQGRLKEQESSNSDPTLVRIYGKQGDCEAAAQNLLSRVRVQKRLVVPLRVHQLIGGSSSDLWRTIRNELHVYIDPENKTITSTSTPPSNPDSEEDKPQPEFQEGTITWVLKGNQQVVEKAVQRCQAAIDYAQANSQVDYVKVPASYHRFIIGRGGSTIQRIRQETGCRVEVPKNGRTRGHRGDISPADSGETVHQMDASGIVCTTGEWVTLIGSQQSIEQAKVLIEEIIDDATY
ncbi:hypothetical protein IWQ62_003018 [Dispira parvispora]|uniref:K Homology domain-containing protein n=1 Tax=Dispira parvispora TaxID=1520584 RepID=A0A9W8E3A4_9FUNG|nr:hypothetical protein IWQ62_003018 [Dispira parvispora]